MSMPDLKGFKVIKFSEVDIGASFGIITEEEFIGCIKLSLETARIIGGGGGIVEIPMYQDVLTLIDSAYVLNY